MKYSVVEVTHKTIVRELPFIFPESFVHKSMYQMVEREYLFEHKADSVRCVAAGFIRSLAVAPAGGCYGKSESLGLKAHRDDTNIIRTFPYQHGLNFPEREK